MRRRHNKRECADHHFVYSYYYRQEDAADGREDDSEDSGTEKDTAADHAPFGNILITKPYPYLARTIFGDVANAKKDEWRGNIEKFKDTYYATGQ